MSPEVAETMGVPMLGIKDAKRLSVIAGNAMSLSTVGIVQLVALCSYQKVLQ